MSGGGDASLYVFEFRLMRGKILRGTAAALHGYGGCLGRGTLKPIDHGRDELDGLSERP